jgi:hypothetical protein
MLMRACLNFVVALLLLTGDMAVAAEAQSETTQLDAGRTNSVKQADVALESLLRRIESLDDLQKDGKGRVISLALHSADANNQNLSLVSTVSSLQELSIFGRGWPSNRWTLEGLAHLKKLTNLVMLRIACLATEPDSNLQFLDEVSHLNGLRSLYLVCASQNTRQYSALTNLQNLTTLLVSYDTNFGNAELSLLTNLPHLKRVDLHAVAVTPQGTNVLSRIESLTNAMISFRR